MELLKDRPWLIAVIAVIVVLVVSRSRSRVDTDPLAGVFANSLAMSATVAQDNASARTAMVSMEKIRADYNAGLRGAEIGALVKWSEAIAKIESLSIATAGAVRTEEIRADTERARLRSDVERMQIAGRTSERLAAETTRARAIGEHYAVARTAIGASATTTQAQIAADSAFLNNALNLAGMAFLGA